MKKRTARMKVTAYVKDRKKILILERPRGGIQILFDMPLRHHHLQQGKLKPSAVSEIVRGRKRTMIGLSLENEEALLMILREREQARLSA